MTKCKDLKLGLHSLNQWNFSYYYMSNGFQSYTINLSTFIQIYFKKIEIVDHHKEIKENEPTIKQIKVSFYIANKNKTKLKTNILHAIKIMNMFARHLDWESRFRMNSRSSCVINVKSSLKFPLIENFNSNVEYGSHRPMIGHPYLRSLITLLSYSFSQP